MDVAQGSVKKRPSLLELAETDQRETKRPKLLSELRVYAEDSGLMLSRTEATLALLRREVEQRAQLFSNDVHGLRASSCSLSSLLPSDSTMNGPPISDEHPNPFHMLSHSMPEATDVFEPKTNDSIGLPSLNGMMAMNKMMSLHSSTGALGRPIHPRQKDSFHKVKLTQPPLLPTAHKSNSFQKPRLRASPADDEDSDSYSAGRENTFSTSPTEKDSVLRKRSRLPPNSVAIFRHWLFNHLESPYPSEDEKEELALKAGLRITQVNNWFTNARRRILPREDGDTQVRARSLSNDLF